jgi:hypothetical protein
VLWKYFESQSPNFNERKELKMSKMNKRMAKTTVALVLVVILVLIPMTLAFAAQPGADCADFSSSPGHSSSAPGSAFNENGMAGTVYAGEQPQNSNNVHSVSQYDVACEKVSQY